MMVFMDLDEFRAIYMCEGRESDTIARFIAHLEARSGDRASLEWACIDMSPAYIAGMERHLPRVKVVYDKFHVVQPANRAVEAVRRLERQDSQDDLKSARRLWLMDKGALLPGQAAFVASSIRKRPRRRAGS